MAVVLLVLLVVLIATGALFAVVKIAFAVAVGVFLGLLALGAFVAWRVRRAWRRAMNPPARRPVSSVSPGPGSPPSIHGSSEVTVLRPDDRGSGPAGQ
jgi:predicted lysophospholipase L1 biosynthesis ABC-type transport system permease subunit